MSASRHCGNDADLVAVLDRRSQVVQIANVLVIEVDVHKTADLAVFENALDHGGKLLSQGVERSLDGRACHFHDGQAVGVLPHGRGNMDTDRHDVSLVVWYPAGFAQKRCLELSSLINCWIFDPLKVPDTFFGQSPAGCQETSAVSRAPSIRASNAANDGLITAGRFRTSATASWVFRPLPVIHRTISSSRPMRSCWMSLRATATVTPPAVSAKMPSVRPRRIMASAISASLTSSAQPPEPRITLMAK